MEPRAPGGEHVGAVEHQQMQVDVQVQRRTEALDERDHAGLSIGPGAQPCTALRRRRQRPSHHPEHAGQQIRSRGKEQAQRPGE